MHHFFERITADFIIFYRLEESQNLVTETVQDSLQERSKVQEVEMRWLAEKDHLLSCLASVQENASLTEHLEAIGRSGSYTDLTQAKSTCELKVLRRDNELLKTEVAEAEDLRNVYESQCLQMEQRMCKLREEKEAAEQMFKERNQKLLKQVEMVKEENMKLDDRRKTDIRGFQSSIRLLREDMKTVVHQMYKLTMAFSGETIPMDFATLNEMQAVATLVRAVQSAISEARRRVLRGESDLVHTVKTTMSDVKTKTIDKGYGPFSGDEVRGEDSLRRRGSRTPSTAGRREEEGRGMRIGTFWRRVCCCWDYPQHPLLPASVVTHRKISRVVSTESLVKETGEMDRSPSTYTVPLDLPLDQMTPQEKLYHIRALNRMYSTSPSTTSTQSIPLELLQSSHLRCNHATNGSARRLSSTPSPSPRPTRPTQLSLASSSFSSRSSSTPTPTGGSTASTPSTPRSRSGSWGVVKAGFSSFMRAVTPTSRPESSLSAQGEDDESHTSDEEEEPEAVRPATGGLDNPTRECYGAVKLAVLGWQGRWVRVGLCGLEGLPWVGGSGGIMLEVGVDPGGRSRWLALPHAHGPNINVKLEAVVKGPREARARKKGVVRVSVWVCGRVWKHGAIGTALTPLVESSGPITAPLHNHSQLTEVLGLVEVCLRCDYRDVLEGGVAAGQGEATLTLEVLRVKNLRAYRPGSLAKAAPSRKRDHVEVVCRAGLWVKGERVERVTSPPVKLPVTQDPVIRTRTVFTLPRNSLQQAAVIIKVVYTNKWAGEDLVGRVQLGPLLYLGSFSEHQPAVPRPSYNTAITLSHWGLALKTPGPTTFWHHLQM
ncbi:Coiled-coil domain-containing protein 77 [Chionoecetes opilio]|uniref:Coiled-coil domain-containing protein 77 n=1 Tax=Chionoecetes opilio TaxID=41210 RepID=A0A8J4XLP0_CHIOP|nr:Coiled-coil domain-containing protein 77 [Chionoecetes opilio]